MSRIVFIPMPRPPSLEKPCRPLPAAEAECQRQSKHDAGQDDKKCSLNDVAANFHLTQRDHDDECHDEILREFSQQIRVRNLRLYAISGDGAADETCKVGAENRDQHRTSTLGMNSTTRWSRSVM